MSRLLSLLIIVAIIVIAPAVVMSWQLSNGVQRDLQTQDASVRVVAGPIGIVTGRINQLRLRAEDATVEGVTVSEIRITLRDVSLDTRRALSGRLVIRRTGSGTASIVVDEAALQRYLTEKREVRNARVHLDDGIATITGTVNVLNSSLEVGLRARLEVARGRDIVLRVEHIGIGGVALPPDLGNALATAVNPLVTAPQQPIPIRFTNVIVDNGRAVITGEPAR
ncbi:MAG TPA: LmeA family phospholipid-binding protein [bacterium]|nr:LmeA family phospholipid-binding protein [bacterium]